MVTKSFRIFTIIVKNSLIWIVPILSLSTGALSARRLEAAIGDVLGTVTFSQDCSSGLGVGITYDGVNLWYSCVASNPDLLRANPLTGEVTASYNIQGGLGALSYDATRNVIWAGEGRASGAGAVLRIALDTTKNITGSQIAFNVSSIVGSCGLDDGLAFDARNLADPSDDVIYYSNDCGTTIIRVFDLSGTLVESFPWGGTSCYNSGVAIGGQLLYQGSNGCNHVWVVDKSTKAAQFNFATNITGDPNFRDEGLTCDTNTFAARGTHVMWSKEAYSPMRAHAFEIRFGSCSPGGKRRQRLAYYALGDSIASGHGLQSGDGQKDGTCRVSPDAYPGAENAASNASTVCPQLNLKPA